MKREIRKAYNSEAETKEILRSAAKESHIPSRLINSFVKEGLECYEKAVKTVSEKSYTFEFRNLF